jgi:hypothetical protein
MNHYEKRVSQSNSMEKKSIHNTPDLRHSNDYMSLKYSFLETSRKYKTGKSIISSRRGDY